MLYLKFHWNQELKTMGKQRSTPSEQILLGPNLVPPEPGFPVSSVLNGAEDPEGFLRRESTWISLAVPEFIPECGSGSSGSGYELISSVALTKYVLCDHYFRDRTGCHFLGQ